MQPAASPADQGTAGETVSKNATQVCAGQKE